MGKYFKILFVVNELLVVGEEVKKEKLFLWGRGWLLLCYLCISGWYYSCVYIIGSIYLECYKNEDYKFRGRCFGGKEFCCSIMI